MPAEQRRLSLLARSALASSLALVAFLGITGFVLEHAYYEGALTAQSQRLQSYLYAYLARFDVRRDGRLIPPDTVPDPDFDRPDSGLYAVVTGSEGQYWASRSARGRGLGFRTRLSPGERRFQGPIASAVGKVFLLSLGVAWDVPGHSALHLSFHIAESDAGFESQIDAFQHTLVLWLSGLGLALLVMQQLLLRWSLWPLRRVRQELRAVQGGESEQLSMDYPKELSGLTRGLNTFIESERQNLLRQRNTLADLAHSLKTPLAVIRARFETDGHDSKANEDVLEQVQRMDDLVAYQLSRASISGRATFAAPLNVAQQAEALVRSLEKVYAQKRVLCEFDIDEEARFFGEQGDLLELLGNLIENAFKWSRRRVWVTARPLHVPGALREGLDLIVEDDGPGIPDDQVELLLQRGVRGDERVQGHGVGLSIVQNLVASYHANLRVDRSETLGGARFSVRIDPVS